MALDNELPDPADELRGDIEKAIEGQESDSDVEGEPEPLSKDEPKTGRDDKGRFRSREDKEAATPPDHASGPEGEVAPARPPEQVRGPPPGFSVASKNEWDRLPQHIRDDIVKRETEVDNGFKRYSGLGRFAEEAERNGTTLQNAVSDYVQVETALRQDFIGGVEFLCQKMGVAPQAFLSAMLQRYGVSGEQAHIPQAVDPNAIATHAANMVRTEFQQRDIDSQIEKFAADPKNKYFQNLRMDMAQIVQAGKAANLQEAYEAACWLNPEIRAILISETNGARDGKAANAVSRARNAAKAVGGSPSSGVNPDGVGKRQNLSIEDEIRAAIAAQEGAA